MPLKIGTSLIAAQEYKKVSGALSKNLQTLLENTGMVMMMMMMMMMSSVISRICIDFWTSLASQH